jgi:hypothetical protein
LALGAFIGFLIGSIVLVRLRGIDGKV